MNAFEWANASTVEDAVKLLAPPADPPDRDMVPLPIAGGQDLRPEVDEGRGNETPPPCQGPRCRQAPSPAAPSAPLRVSDAPREQICRLACLVSDVSSRAIAFGEQEEVSPQPGYPQSLLRPPCAAV